MGTNMDLRTRDRSHPLTKEWFPTAWRTTATSPAPTRTTGPDVGADSPNEFNIPTYARKYSVHFTIEMHARAAPHGPPMAAAAQIDESRRLPRRAFAGGYHMDQKKDEPAKDGFYDNVVDAGRYPITALTMGFGTTRGAEVRRQQPPLAAAIEQGGTRQMTQPMRQALAEDSSALQDAIVPFLRRRIDAATDHWGSGTRRRKRRSSTVYRVPDAQDKKTRQETLTEGVEKIVVPYRTRPCSRSWRSSCRSSASGADHPCPRRRPDGSHLPATWVGPPLPDGEHEPAGDARHLPGCLTRGATASDRQTLHGARMGRSVRTFSTDPMTGQQTDDVQEEDVTAHEGNEALNVSPSTGIPIRAA